MERPLATFRVHLQVTEHIDEVLLDWCAYEVYVALRDHGRDARDARILSPHNRLHGRFRCVHPIELDSTIPATEDALRLFDKPSHRSAPWTGRIVENVNFENVVLLCHLMKIGGAGYIYPLGVRGRL